MQILVIPHGSYIGVLNVNLSKLEGEVTHGQKEEVSWELQPPSSPISTISQRVRSAQVIMNRSIQASSAFQFCLIL